MKKPSPWIARSIVLPVPSNAPWVNIVCTLVMAEPLPTRSPAITPPRMSEKFARDALNPVVFTLAMLSLMTLIASEWEWSPETPVYMEPEIDMVRPFVRLEGGVADGDDLRRGDAVIADDELGIAVLEADAFHGARHDRRGRDGVALGVGGAD